MKIPSKKIKNFAKNMPYTRYAYYPFRHNWADWFAANISDNKVVVVPVAHTFNLSGDAGLNKEIITTNYNRYRVFRK